MIADAERASSSSPGLSSALARALLETHGPNRAAPVRRRATPARLLLKPLTDPMAVLLLLAAGTYLALHDTFDALTALIALVPVSVVSLVLEARADRALDRLADLVSPTARVWRDGSLTTIPSEDIVPGDAVVLREGDVVPADGRLLAADSLSLDESSLTGESEPAEKRAGATGDRARVSASTIVLSGHGTFRVEKTGEKTAYGAVARLVATAHAPPTPMQRRMAALVRRLSIGATIVCLVVTAVEAWRGHSLAVGVIAGVSLAMAAIPEEFPMVYALYLALGAWRLARDNALVRRLSSVETLGSATVICTDKTGTLTTGRVEAVSFSCAAGVTEKQLWNAAQLACAPDGFDPIDRAIVRAAPSHGVGALDEAVVVSATPFDVRSKTVRREWQIGLTRHLAAKGAIEGILAMAGADADVHAAAAAANERYAARGMRVLAVSGSTGGARLAFLGLIAFADPVREDVKTTLAECLGAGVRVLIVTGDHASTAQAVAKDVGMPEPLRVVTGDAIDAADDEALAAMAARSGVFARTRPEQKHRLVRVLQRQGDVVAMTGDGTNDAPALREADIGIAMGRRGTEVAREAADLILLDDDFSTIVRAVRDGRRIFDNLRRAIAYLIAFHMPLLIAAFVLPLMGAPLMLLPIHLVWLEVIVHPTSSLVFEADKGSSDLMRRPPRSKDGELVSGSAMARALIDGSVLGVVCLSLYLHQLGTAHADDARAAAIATMILGQTGLILLERRPHAFIWRAAEGSSVVLPAVIAITLAGLYVALHVPSVSSVLQVAPLSASEWSLCLAAAAGAVSWREPVKLVRAWLGRPSSSSLHGSAV